MSNTIDEQEIVKFEQMSDEWWSANGKFKPLHQFNPIRIAYIKENLLNHFNHLNGLKVLDVGCGGGLLCEPLKRLGIDIVGIDAGQKNISIAKIHAQKSGLDIDYRNQDVEDLAATDEKFDVVLAMEIVEHVSDVPKFLAACSACLKPGGIVFVATLNRTIKSFLNAIVGAEYILRWLPIKTHNWQKFLKPSEINNIAESNGLKLLDLTGFSYNLLSGEWKRSNDLLVNYVILYQK